MIIIGCTSVIEHSLMCPSHFPHRHYTHSQQPVHCTKPCGGHGQADELSRYTTQCEGEDQRAQQGWRAAATWMYPLLSKIFPLCLMGLGVSRRGAALPWTRGCSNCNQSLYSKCFRYNFHDLWVRHVYVRHQIHKAYDHDNIATMSWTMQCHTAMSVILYYVTEYYHSAPLVSWYSH